MEEEVFELERDGEVFIIPVSRKTMLESLGPGAIQLGPDEYVIYPDEETDQDSLFDWLQKEDE